MKEVIPFKKEIIFKTRIAQITDISLTHDYKIKEDVIEGQFYLSGTYKMTEASVINEEYMYTIPFSIALGENILKETINLELSNFNYKILKDVMSLNMELILTCEKKEIETIKEDIEKMPKEEIKEDSFDNENFEKEFEEMINEKEINIKSKEDFIDPTDNINILKNTLKDEKEYSTYKIYIVRNDDTYESIASKYNVSLSDLLDYNNVEEINIGDKVIIPYIKNE